MAAVHQMLFNIPNREDPESDLGLHCLSRPCWQAQNFRTYIVDWYGLYFKGPKIWLDHPKSFLKRALTVNDLDVCYTIGHYNMHMLL